MNPQNGSNVKKESERNECLILFQRPETERGERIQKKDIKGADGVGGGAGIHLSYVVLIIAKRAL